MKGCVLMTSLLVMALTAAAFAIPASAEISKTDLGSLGGGWARPNDINNKGQIVGLSRTGSGDEHAFIWQDGVMADLGTLSGGDYSEAIAINDNGQVVGMGNAGNGSVIHLVLWQNGAMTDLGAFGGLNTVPVAINGSGQVIGFNDNAGFIWQDGVFTAIGSPDGELVVPSAINNQGQVAGTITSSGEWMGHPFIWQHGAMTRLCDGTGNVAGINEAGQVAGYEYYQYEARAFIWRNGEVVYLDKAGWPENYSMDINKKGQVVGYLYHMMDAEHAFLWQDGVTTDIGTLGGWANHATAVNNFGQIIGQSSILTGDPVHEKNPCFWQEGAITELGKYSYRTIAINDLGQVIGADYSNAALWNTRKIVSIDINPGKRSKTTRIRKGGVIPVAVLGSTGFDARLVDPATVSLYGAPVKLDKKGRRLYTDADVNGDGIPDRVFQVSTDKILLTKYDTVAVFQGKTYEGVPVSGWDSIVVKK